MADDFDYDELKEELQDDEKAENILKDYLEYWKEQYSPEFAGLSLPAKLQRERILKKPGEWEKMQQTNLAKVRQRVEERAKKIIAEKLVCQNITPEESKQIPKDLLVSFLIQIKRKNDKTSGPIQTKKVCYVIPTLYAYLIGRYGPKPTDWIDPHTKTAYTFSQRQKLEKVFDKTFHCSNSKISGVYRVEPKAKGKGSGYG